MLERDLITAEQAITLLQSAGPDAEEPSFDPASVTPAVAVPAPAPAPAPAPVIQAVAQPAAEAPPAARPEPTPAEEVLPDPFRQRAKSWSRWWWIPLWAGIGITLVGALLMYFAWDRAGLSFWFVLTWFPFLFGVMVMALAWASSKARWLHVRIRNISGGGPRSIALSFPLPLRLAAWAVRTFHVNIPNMEGANLDELILALERTGPDGPCYVQVEDDDDGEQVEVYIG